MSQSEQQTHGNFLRRVASAIRNLVNRLASAVKSIFAKGGSESRDSEPSATITPSRDVPLQEALVTIRSEVQNLVASPGNLQEVTDPAANDQVTPKAKSLHSPPLPKEHRLLVKRCVRGGNRKLAEQKLEELGYLFPEVHTRGAYIVVNYRGVDGYLYTARFRYK